MLVSVHVAIPIAADPDHVGTLTRLGVISYKATQPGVVKRPARGL